MRRLLRAYYHSLELGSEKSEEIRRKILELEMLLQHEGSQTQ